MAGTTDSFDCWIQPASRNAPANAGRIKRTTSRLLSDSSNTELANSSVRVSGGLVTSAPVLEEASFAYSTLKARQPP